MNAVRYIDEVLVRERCLALALSRRELASRIGVSAAVIRNIEGGSNHSEFSLGFLAALAAELGVELRDLLATGDSKEDVPAPAPDDVKVEAVLMEAGKLVRPDDLALGLGWGLDRVRKAVDALEARLRGTGLRLRRSNGGVAVQSRPGIVSSVQREGVERARLGSDGLRVNSARVLKDVLAGRVDTDWERAAKIDQRVQLYKLLKQGLVEQDGDRFVVRTEVEYSLS